MKISPRQRLHGSAAGSCRRGSAAVELVMMVPLLALLLALLFTVGSAAVSSLNVAVDARREAWSTAREGVSASPLDLRGASSDLAMRSASQPLAYSLPRLGLGDAQAQFSSLQGSWDHRELLSDEGVHFSAVKKVAAIDLDSPDDPLSNFLSAFGQVSALQGKFDEGLIRALILSAMGISESDLDVQGRLEGIKESIKLISKAADEAIKKLDKLLKDATNPAAIKKKIEQLRDAIDELNDL